MDPETIRWLITALLTVAVVIGGGYVRSIAGSLKDCASGLRTLHNDIWKDGGLKDILERQIDDSRHKMVKEVLQPKFAEIDREITALKLAVARIEARSIPMEPGVRLVE